ncbi:hypothetical protein TURU_149488 [Turdus rufiventris]|nr:hypothetical protein TURU_149488 [Turdus rufiventris]
MTCLGLAKVTTVQSGIDVNYLVFDQKLGNDMYCCILKKLKIGNSFGNLPLGAEVGMMGKMSLKPRNRYPAANIKKGVTFELALVQHVFLASQDLIQDMQNLSSKDFAAVEVVDLKSDGLFA